jgi:hypothetical protein
MGYSPFGDFLKIRLKMKMDTRPRMQRPIKVKAPQMMGFMKAYRIRARIAGIRKMFNRNPPMDDEMAARMGRKPITTSGFF